ncbi:MAG: iron-sulfur cluster assembly accessory protein [Candidatus Dojkabacteria bacterium]|nr:iron-sulfur cluster assembly accessory protein [Candidatus Dojkabacteria bacterium]
MILKIHENAKNFIKNIMKNQNKRFLKISLKNKGCGGKSYDFSLLNDEETTNKNFEVVPIDEDFFIVIEMKDLLFLFGSEIILKESILEKKLDIINSNEQGRCGCGKSFI